MIAPLILAAAIFIGTSGLLDQSYFETPVSDLDTDLEQIDSAANSDWELDAERGWVYTAPEISVHPSEPGFAETN